MLYNNNGVGSSSAVWQCLPTDYTLGYGPSDIASIQTEDFEEKYKTLLPQYRGNPLT